MSLFSAGPDLASREHTCACEQAVRSGWFMLVPAAMRVLLVTDALPPVPRGGLDLHVRELEAELLRRGHSVLVWAAAGEAPDALGSPDEGPPGSRLMRTVRSQERVEEFETRLRIDDPDVVHFHNLQGLSTKLPEVARRFGAQVVWTHHDLFVFCPKVHLRRGDGTNCDGPRNGVACGPCVSGQVRGMLAAPVFALRHASFKDACRLTHAHIAPSSWVRDFLVAEGVPEDRVHVVGAAVPSPDRIANLPGRAGPARIVYAGDLREAKGADLAVEAMRYIDPAQARLEIHGGSPAPPGKPEEAFETALRTAAEGLAVTFHGRFEPTDLPDILDGATALLVPSRVRETFGRTANLAWQLGVPVVAADHGALGELATDGQDGTLFVPGEAASLTTAIQRVIRDGILMQAEYDQWGAPDLRACVDALLPHYIWRP